MLSKIAKLFRFVLQMPGLLLALYFYIQVRDVVDEDLKRLSPIGGGKALIFRMFDNVEFRNLFYHRIGKEKSLLIKPFLPINPNLHIFESCIIGPGLVIVHGDCTYINAKTMGSNCYVNQGVTIGVIGNKKPILGDNVRVATNALVLGDVKIGNNVTIAAGCVVVKDVPDNCLVAGNPAYIKRKNGEKVNIKL